MTIGEQIWDRFSAPREETLWYYRSLANVFLSAYPSPLAQRLDRTVTALGA